MTALETAAAAAMVGGPVIPLMLYTAHRASYRSWPVSTTAVLVTAVAIGAAMSATTPLLALAVVVCGMPAAIVDTLERRLPDVLTAGLAVAAAVAVPLVRSDRILPAAAAALLSAATVITIKMIAPPVLGWGDVKIIPALAAILTADGTITLYRGILLWAVLLMLTVLIWWPSRSDEAETVPYGPALIVGAVGALLAA